MNIEELEEEIIRILSENGILSPNFYLNKNNSGEIVIHTKLKENQEGELEDPSVDDEQEEEEEDYSDIDEE
jgi:protein-tyrosine-phosphatase